MKKFTFTQLLDQELITSSLISLFKSSVSSGYYDSNLIFPLQNVLVYLLKYLSL